MAKIIIGADFVPLNRHEKSFISGNIEEVLDNKLIQVINDADIRIFNLEAPITIAEDRLPKSGPNLKVNPKCINGLKKLNPTVMSLANNHIMDYGIQGLSDTISILQKNKIHYVGAGKNFAFASKPFIYRIKDINVGIYSCSEHEFSCADANKPGAAPFEPLESFDIIHELKNNVDFIIVLYHGGKEHYKYPTVSIQKRCRKFIEKGADMVICQHSHCIGSYEKYRNGDIIYGQGNFMFDLSDNINWQTGLLVTVETENRNIEFIPFVNKGKIIKMAESKEKEKILNEFLLRSDNITNIDFIRQEQEKEALKSGSYYMRIFTGSNLFLRILGKILKNHLWDRLYTKENKRSLVNIIRCETHREMILTYLEKMLG